MTRAALRPVLSVLMVTMGVLHFTHAATFVSVMPAWLPQPLLLVYVSGVFEIALGLMLSYAPTQVLAGWGLIALFVAVFPANINMALHPDLPLAGVPEWLPRPSAIGLWLRLPMQAALIYWAWLYTKPLPVKLASHIRSTKPA
jgi:uncharacterized membrane protein